MLSEEILKRDIEIGNFEALFLDKKVWFKNLAKSFLEDEKFLTRSVSIHDALNCFDYVKKRINRCTVRITTEMGHDV